MAEHERHESSRPHIALEAHENKQRAEQLLTTGSPNANGPDAIAWALLAVAGELHSIRTELRRESRRSR
ncbi:hypothetical protein [Streptomyces sp. STCH 565 A]|uniref:hypothetical protein n=1 Tax=Streptomyces sp. STCH 565 A TaxID=2950532 RepID=UPI002075296C|nr:hypothetical protein [Streptomyces sp. STCH 565 A]MCM8550067.1 hypothetical protein [Streptomyces sp. STCH 565 A]